MVILHLALVFFGSSFVFNYFVNIIFLKYVLLVFGLKYALCVLSAQADVFKLF